MDGEDRNDVRELYLPPRRHPDAQLTIGQLARRTGLSVKTIRWYSDQGLVPPAGRSAAGYRRAKCALIAFARFEPFATG